jgi:twitching motility protein PilT
MLDFFPPEQQQQVRFTMAGSLRGIICQRLLPGADGGRQPTLEVLVNTGRIADRIVNPDITSEIEEVISKSSYYGMCTFDQSLVQLVKEGRITIEAAMEGASSPHDLTLMLQQEGIISVDSTAAAG